MFCVYSVMTSVIIYVIFYFKINLSLYNFKFEEAIVCTSFKIDVLYVIISIKFKLH